MPEQKSPPAPVRMPTRSSGSSSSSFQASAAPTSIVGAEGVLGLRPVQGDGEDVAVALDDEVRVFCGIAVRLEHVLSFGRLTRRASRAALWRTGRPRCGRGPRRCGRSGPAARPPCGPARSAGAGPARSGGTGRAPTMTRARPRMPPEISIGIWSATYVGARGRPVGQRGSSTTPTTAGPGRASAAATRRRPRARARAGRHAGLEAVGGAGGGRSGSVMWMLRGRRPTARPRGRRGRRRRRRGRAA